MGKFLSHIIIIATISLGFCACSTDGCLENQSSIPLAGFYASENGKQIVWNSLDVYGVGATGDSLLIAAGNESGQTYLPFRATQNSTAFCFHYGDYGDDTDYNDTIWFEYESTPYFASEECGAMYRYKITSVKHTDIIIDSVVIVDPEITNVDVERIKIYFMTE